MRHLSLLLLCLLVFPAPKANAEPKPQAAKAKKNPPPKALIDLLNVPVDPQPVDDVLSGAPEADLERMRREIEPCRAEIGPAAGARWRRIELIADGPQCELVEAAKAVRSELAACYDALVARRPEAEGSLTLRFAPGEAPRRAEGSGLDGTLEQCVVAALQEKAPKAAQGTLTLDFAFFGSSGAVAPGR